MAAVSFASFRARAAANMAPVRVDIVLVMDVVDPIDLCDFSLSVDEVRSSVFVGDIRPFDDPDPDPESFLESFW